MKAFNNKDEYITGMSYSKLLGHSNVSSVNISKEKEPDWFNDHTNSNIEAFALRTMIKARKSENEKGIFSIKDIYYVK